MEMDETIGDLLHRAGHLEGRMDAADTQRAELLAELRDIKRSLDDLRTRLEGQAKTIARAGAIVMLLTGVAGFFSGKLSAYVGTMLK
jgi:chromosome segregation ATPase